jgi:ACS family tartrate transporter-like MFS transporter
MALGVSIPPVADAAALAASTRRKIAWRILPLIFLLYIVAYLDRANAGFAKLQMQELLHFDPDVFGTGFGIFFVGYLILEIPGALLVEHWSARKWFTRILLTWGLCSMGMALVQTPWQFYLARFLLGLAEAGFFPGVIVYFTHWFPRADRGRAMAALVLGIPVCLGLGAQVSGELLKVNWFGWAGWQWVFILEGLPAVLLGIALPFVLCDRPRQAQWLTAAECDWLEQTLEAERPIAAKEVTLRQTLRQPTVWLLALGIFVTNTGGYALVFWLPTAVKGFLSAAGREATENAVLNWTGLVYLCGLPGVWLAGRSSDYSGERKWHCVVSQVLTGGFLAASVLPGQPWSVVFVWLCLVGFFAPSWPPTFWVLPTLTLSASAAAVSIGFINICANLAGLVGNKLFGELQAARFSDGVCLFVLACCFFVGGTIVAWVPIPTNALQASASKAR